MEDALHATRAAVEEGIVPGGGVSLIRATSALDALKGANDGETTGIKIVRRAVEEPLRQISANAGQEGALVVENVTAKKTPGYGYNAATEEYGDLVKMGVIDPTKVVHTALSNAASIAALLLTTDAMVTEEPEEKELAAAGGGHPHPH